MKKFLLVCVIAAVLVSCKDKTTGTTATNDSASASSPAKAVDLPYSKTKPVDWEWGSNDNIAVAMNALKAYQNNQPEECAKYFADTADLQFDHLDKKISRDSLAAFFKAGWVDNKHIDIKMDDYESVISKDKSIEYVSLWYKEIMTDSKGKIDSLDVMNDCKMKNGKIVLLSEKTRHYGQKKM